MSPARLCCFVGNLRNGFIREENISDYRHAVINAATHMLVACAAGQREFQAVDDEPVGLPKQAQGISSIKNALRILRLKSTLLTREGY